MASKYQKFIIESGSPSKTIFTCILCGFAWSPSIKESGRWYRNSYKCPNKCSKNYDEAIERKSKMLFQRHPHTNRLTPIIGSAVKRDNSPILQQKKSWYI